MSDEVKLSSHDNGSNNLSPGSVYFEFTLHIDDICITDAFFNPIFFHSASDVSKINQDKNFLTSADKLSDLVLFRQEIKLIGLKKL